MPSQLRRAEEATRRHHVLRRTYDKASYARAIARPWATMTINPHQMGLAAVGNSLSCGFVVAYPPTLGDDAWWNSLEFHASEERLTPALNAFSFDWRTPTWGGWLRVVRVPDWAIGAVLSMPALSQTVRGG